MPPWNSLGALTSASQDGESITLQADRGSLRLTFVDEGVVRVELSGSDQSERLPSIAVLENRGDPIVPHLSESDQQISIHTKSLRVLVRKAPLLLSIYDAEGRLVLADQPDGHGWDGPRTKTWKRLATEQRFYGFGEKSGRLNKRGKSLAMWTTDPQRYGADDDPLYQAIPFFLSTTPSLAFGVLLDNTFRTSFDLGPYVATHLFFWRRRRPA